MELKFLGRGAAFYPAFGNTNAFFTEGEALFFLDFGESAFEKAVRLLDLRKYRRVWVLITHLHADHAGSLASLCSYTHIVLGVTVRVVHPESTVQAEDLRWLREKVEAGADFLTTQMFFDNNLLYNFLYKLRETGVTVPVVPGIMPITKANQVKRALKLSGSFMPRRFTSLVDKFGSSPEAMQRAGVIYACDQIIDLYANGIRHVHVYTMNKPDVAAAILNHLNGMLGRTF